MIFYLSKYELTFAEYDAFCEDTGREKAVDEDWGRDQRPAINVSWDDAIAYCNWRSERENLEKVYSFDRGGNTKANWSANGYRLPTEAEWEFAARSGGKDYKYTWGDGKPIGNLRDDQWDNHDDGYEKTAPVGLFQQGDLGLFDMNGNVWEWCWDWFDLGYYGNSPVDNPRGPDSGSDKVMRGASWNGRPDDARCTYRLDIYKDFKADYVGIRLARSVVR